MNIKQGEIWEVEFFPNVGSEIGKRRPALVINYDGMGKLPLKTIVPITNYSKSYKNYPWMIKLDVSNTNGLSKLSAIDCFQIRNFSHSRFTKRLGLIEKNLLFKVHETVLKTLNPVYTIS